MGLLQSTLTVFVVQPAVWKRKRAPTHQQKVFIDKVSSFQAWDMPKLSLRTRGGAATDLTARPKSDFLSPYRIKETGRTKRVPTTRGVPRPSPIQVLTAPDVALLARSDGFACIQRGMVVDKSASLRCTLNTLSKHQSKEKAPSSILMIEKQMRTQPLAKCLFMSKVGFLQTKVTTLSFL